MHQALKKLKRWYISFKFHSLCIVFSTPQKISNISNCFDVGSSRQRDVEKFYFRKTTRKVIPSMNEIGEDAPSLRKDLNGNYTQTFVQHNTHFTTHSPPRCTSKRARLAKIFGVYNYTAGPRRNIIPGSFIFHCWSISFLLAQIEIFT